MDFSNSTKKHLGYYVYGLVDPRDNKIFYIGKAFANNRAFDHLKSSRTETDKQKKIREIRQTGHEPIVDIIRYGLDTEAIAFEIEAAVIDAIGIEHLTNAVRGHGIEKGRMLASELERLYGSAPIVIEDISEPCILFFLNETYSPTLSEQELYDCTRQFWGIGKNERESLSHRTALAIVEGVVIRAYNIQSWHPAGSTFSSREYDNKQKGKWEFVGQVIKDHRLVGRKLIEHNGETIKAIQKGYMYLPRA